MGLVHGSMLGLCVGDALGVPVEFYNRKQLVLDPVTGMQGYGTHNQPEGTWSDDSSLTFSLMESLIKGYDTNNIADSFVDWYKHNKWTPHGVRFDIGFSTRYALDRRINGTPATECGGREEEDNGNGSLMRILPLAFYCQKFTRQERYKIVQEVSSITHAHKRSILGCQIYVELAINLINGYSLDEAYLLTQSNILRDFSTSKEVQAYSVFFSGSIKDLKKEDIKSTGYVVDALVASMWCVLNQDNYADTVLTAVNLGGDADTTAAIAGGLAGIIYGVEGIPTAWLFSLSRYNDICELCDVFELFVKNN